MKENIELTEIPEGIRPLNDCIKNYVGALAKWGRSGFRGHYPDELIIAISSLRERFSR